LENIISVVISLLYFIIVIGVAARLRALPYHFSRYFTHMMVANAWFLSLYFIKDGLLALIVPALYTVFSLLNYIYNWLPALNSRYQVKNFGSVYFAMSNLVLTWLAYVFPSLAIGAGMGLMVMAYGDGFAAMVGMHAGRYRYTIFHGHKTLEGSFTMWCVSLAVLLLVTLFHLETIPWMMIVLLASLATFVEAISPYGLDNVFIPFLVYLLYILLVI
jgi:phytol kinase